jgi:ribulose kinase
MPSGHVQELDIRAWDMGTVPGCAYPKLFWMAEGGQSATGELLRHAIETHPACNQALAKATSLNLNIYDYLNLHLKNMAESLKAPSISYLSCYMFFYGDLWGNRSPIVDPQMKGSIIGLTSNETLNNLAVYYFSTMNNAGHSISSIFISGS